MSRRKKTLQRDLPVVGDCFNLVQETGDDPLRVILDRLHEASEKAAAREYQLKMQRTFAECPGFLSGDAPASELGRGYVVVLPETLADALPWLRRRFVCSETMEFDRLEGGLRIEIAPRPKKGSPRRRVKVNFQRPEQFNLNLENIGE